MATVKDQLQLREGKAFLEVSVAGVPTGEKRFLCCMEKATLVPRSTPEINSESPQTIGSGEELDRVLKFKYVFFFHGSRLELSHFDHNNCLRSK